MIPKNGKGLQKGKAEDADARANNVKADAHDMSVCVQQLQIGLHLMRLLGVHNHTQETHESDSDSSESSWASGPTKHALCCGELLGS